MNWEVIAYSSATVGVIFSILAIIYYITTAKNIKKQHARYENILKNLKVGDKVVFAGGLVGIIQSIDSDRVFADVKVHRTTLQTTLYSISNIIEGE